MNLIELTSIDKERYNRFVAEAPSGSFLQAWEWGEWQEKLAKQAFRFFVADDGGNIIASLQIIQSPLPMGKFYLYIPYGPVVPVIPSPGKSGEESLTSMAELRDSSARPQTHSDSVGMTKIIVDELIKRFPDAVFIRLEPKFDLSLVTRGLLLIKSPNIQPAKTLVVDLKKTEDELLAEMHPKTRYNIRLAQRHGVEVSADLIAVPGHGLYVKEALDMIVQTADRQSFQTFSRSYYQQLLDFFALENFGGEIKIFLYKALLNRQLLSAAVMVDFSARGGSASGGGTRTYLFGGSSEHRREVMAPFLLHFRAIQDAKAAGLSQYDFWGIETAGGETPGFVRFKLGFGGKSVSYPGAWDIKLRRGWYHGYKTLRRVNRVLLRLRLFR
jgi:peptidoglycan pentaglycine glycine transferase (the first glycine)